MATTTSHKFSTKARRAAAHKAMHRPTSAVVVAARIAAKAAVR